ncbi:SLC13A5 family protein [Megaselia abdita]
MPKKEKKEKIVNEKNEKDKKEKIVKEKKEKIVNEKNEKEKKENIVKEKKEKIVNEKKEKEKTEKIVKEKKEKEKTEKKEKEKTEKTLKEKKEKKVKEQKDDPISHDGPSSAAQPSTTYYLDEEAQSKSEDKAPKKKLTCCRKCRLFFKNHWNGLLALVIPSLLAFLLFIDFTDFKPKKGNMDLNECVFVVMVILYYWLTEPIPTGITALLPIIFMPTLEILEPEVVSSLYFTNDAIMVICGTMAALSIEYCGLHNKMALALVRIFGYRLRLLHLVTMSITFVLSMFSQDIIITAFMCPVITALLNILGHHFKLIRIYADTKDYDPDHRPPSRVAVGFYLGICYTVAIGGTSTLIGGGANSSVQQTYDASVYPNTRDENKITFKNFTAFAMLPSLCLFFLTYLTLEILFLGLLRPKRKLRSFGILETKKKLNLKPIIEMFGKITSDQIIVLTLFVSLIIVFVNRTVLLGWEQYFATDKQPLESLPTVLLVVIYFAVPKNLSFFRYWIEGDQPLPRREIPSLVKWRFLCNRLPWENFFITGCAASISQAMVETRVFDKLGILFDYVKGLKKELVIFIFITLQYLLTQFTESATVVNLFMELLKNATHNLDFHPLYFAMPIAFVGNMSFMLPVSTPSNLIVSSLSNAKMSDYLFAGFFVTMISYMTILVTVMFWTRVVFPDLPTTDIFIANVTSLKEVI